MTLAQRMVVINAGRAEQIGTPMEVYENPATQFVAGFIGSPSMNFLAGRSEGGGRDRARARRRRAASRRHGGGRARRDGRDPPGASRSDRTGPTRLFSATVEMVEQLGADTLVHLARGKDLLTARLPHGTRPEVGTTLHSRPPTPPASTCSTPAQGPESADHVASARRRMAVSAPRRPSRRGQGRAGEHADRDARRSRARLPDGRVRRQARRRQPRLPAARRHARADDERPRPRRRAALARAVAPRRRRLAFGQVRGRAAADARVDRALGARARRRLQHRDQADDRPRARDGRGRRARRDGAVARRRRPAAPVVVLRGSARRGARRRTGVAARAARGRGCRPTGRPASSASVASRSTLDHEAITAELVANGRATPAIACSATRRTSPTGSPSSPRGAWTASSPTRSTASPRTRCRRRCRCRSELSGRGGGRPLDLALVDRQVDEARERRRARSTGTRRRRSCRSCRRACRRATRRGSCRSGG